MSWSVSPRSPKNVLKTHQNKMDAPGIVATTVPPPAGASALQNQTSKDAPTSHSFPRGTTVLSSKCKNARGPRSQPACLQRIRNGLRLDDFLSRTAAVCYVGLVVTHP